LFRIANNVLSHGKGIYVYDEHGREYVEGLGELWCVSLGFGEEALVNAAVTQMRWYKWV
jgi:4-aminobutyrate--pyruvate transaminase